MHPGPMNRGVEMVADPGEMPGSVILNQVTNGVAVRMAVLFWLLGSGSDLNRRDGRCVMSRSSSPAARCWTRPANVRRRRHRGRAHRRAVGAGLAGDRHGAGRHRLHRLPRLRRPARAPARAGQGGSRDHRDRQPCRGARRVHRRRRDAQHRAGAGQRRVVDFVRAQGRKAGLCEVLPRAASPSVVPARCWRRTASSLRLACTCSPTTATVCRIRS